jgi:CHAT domain-containing protein
MNHRLILHFVFLFFLMTCFAACQSNADGIVQVKFSTINADSLIAVAKADTNIASSKAFLLNCLKANRFSTLDELHIQLVLGKKESGDAQHAIMQTILAKDSFLTQSEKGKEILVKAAVAEAYYNFTTNNKQQVLKCSDIYFANTNPRLDSVYKISICGYLGIVFEQLGDTKKAISNYLICKELMDKTNNKKGYYSTISNLCISYYHNNEKDKAFALANNVLQTISPKDDQYADYLYLKTFYQLGSNAIQNIHQLESFITKYPNAKYTITAMVDLLDYYFEEKKFEKLYQAIHHIIGLNDLDERQQAKLYLQYAQALVQQQQTDSAIVYLDKALQLVCATNTINGCLLPVDSLLAPENTIYDIMLAKADLLLQKNKSDSSALQHALRYLLTAQKVADLLQLQLVFDESKYENGVDAKLVTEKLLEVYYLLHQKNNNQQYAQNAFVIAEKAKAIALQDNIEKEILGQAAKDTNYAAFVELKKQLAALEIELSAVSTGNRKDSMQAQCRQLEEKLSMYKSVNDELLPANPQQIKFAELQVFLKEHQLNAIHFFEGDSAVYVLAYDRSTTKIQFNKINKSISDSIVLLNGMQQSQNGLVEEWNRVCQLSNYVYTQLLGTVTVVLANNQTLIMADGNLYNLAFDALLTSAKDANSYLIKQGTTSMAYSIRSLMGQQARAWMPQSGITCFMPFATKNIGKYPVLKNSVQEINACQQHFTTQVFKDEQATFNHFVKHIANNDYVHIASHAVAGQQPQLIFADSAVYANSIYHTPMHHAMVYVNTCESGAGQATYTEGNLSLARAFYSNGVHNVVYSLWNANDASSAAISMEYYKQLKRHHNSAMALYLAKLNYLATQPKDKQLPYYWAMMQHLGDGQLQNTSSGVWWKVLLAIACIAGIVIYLFSKKR